MNVQELDPRMLAALLGGRRPKPTPIKDFTTSLVSLPLRILPKWYFGVAAIAGFGLMIGAELGYVAALPLWLLFLPFYAPLVPTALLLATLLALGVIVAALYLVYLLVKGIASLFRTKPNKLYTAGLH